MRPVALAAWLAAASLGAGAPSLCADASSGFTLTEVKPGVFAAIAPEGERGNLANAGFVIGSDAVLVVDSLGTPQAAEALLAAIRSRTGLPIRWLIDTHHHLDHCGGNGVFAKAGAVVVAQERSRARMQARGAPDALPSLTYREAISIWLGDRRVDVFTLPGHTDGDSLISVPDAGVLFGGDLVLNRAVPNLADADADAWVKTLDELAVRFGKAALIPGHGPIARPLDMRPLRDFLVGLRLSVGRGLQEGKRGEALASELMPRLLAQCRGWSGTEHLGEAVRQMEQAITGKSKAPAAPTPGP